MSCPRVSTKKAESKIHELLQAFDQAPDKNKGDHIVEFFDMDETHGGGKAKTRRRRRRSTMRGGSNLFSRSNIRITIYFIVAALVAFAFTGRNVATVREGINMLLNGDCPNVNNTLWGYLNLENPVCRLHNEWYNVLLNALKGDAKSIAMLSGIVTIAAGTPYGIASAIENLAIKIENSINVSRSRLHNLARSEEVPVLQELQGTDDSSSSRLFIENGSSQSATPPPPLAIENGSSALQTEPEVTPKAKKPSKSRTARSSSSSSNKRKSKSPTPTTRRTTPKLFPGQTTY